jgi:pyruvate dehydrogenase E2 component (dihydrolipoamide acetyltransferase)
LTDSGTETEQLEGWVPFTRLQAAVARRMTLAKTTIPEFSTTIDVDMDAARAFRESRRAADGVAPTLNDLVIKACALALRSHPKLNASVGEGGVQMHSHVNVGVAVAADDRLLVPTVFDADRMPLSALSAAVRDVVARMRAGKISQRDLTDGTFTVSNLGMLGVSEFEAIVNPPQVAILAVGAVRPTPVVRGQSVGVAHVARLTLVSDHRAVYGADAARFLGAVRDLLESPDDLTG